MKSFCQRGHNTSPRHIFFWDESFPFKSVCHSVTVKENMANRIILFCIPTKQDFQFTWPKRKLVVQRVNVSSTIAIINNQKTYLKIFKQNYQRKHQTVLNFPPDSCIVLNYSSSISTAGSGKHLMEVMYKAFFEILYEWGQSEYFSEEFGAYEILSK